MQKCEMKLNEMVNFVNYLSTNVLHDTHIVVFEKNGFIKEIACTSRLKLIERVNMITLKSELSKSRVSFSKNDILEIYYEIADLKHGFAEIYIKTRKKRISITVMIDLIDNCPILGEIN